MRRLGDAARAAAISRELVRHDGWSREGLAAHQRDRLTDLVRYAAARSPFYRRLYAGLDLDGPVDLARLPVTDKATLMAHFDDVVTDPRLRLDDLERHLSGLVGDDLHLGAYRVFATGGSTGRRGVFVADRAEWRTYLAGLLRINAYLGLRPGLPRRRVATVAAARPAHVTYRMSRGLDTGAHRVLRLDATDDIGRLVARLNKFRPQFLYGYPSVLELLAAEHADGRLRIAPMTLASSGETLTAGTQRAVRAAWDVPWFQIYGTTEMPVLGAHCDRHTGLHLFEDLAIVEVLEDRLLMTNLVARAQPLIRYAVTDLTATAPAPCPCGRPYRLLAGVDGRGDDILSLPAAGGGRVTVHPLALRGPMATVAGLRQYRIIHEGHTLTVIAALRRTTSPDAATAAITTGLRAALGTADVTLSVRIVPTLADGRDAAGKLRIIESRP
jgi:phenylacetate-coenzyme A ligase PaaK-like adenylate-forming protein